MRAREEKYWAGKKQEEEAAGAEAEAATGDGDGDGEEDGGEQALAEAAAASARGGPLSAELLERVARAKEAERARRVHEALAVVEMARWVKGLVFGVWGFDGLCGSWGRMMIGFTRTHTRTHTGGGSRLSSGSSRRASPRPRAPST